MNKNNIDNSKKKIAEYKSTVQLLTPLVGITYTQMSKTQQETLLIALGQLVGVLDETGKVKPV